MADKKKILEHFLEKFSHLPAQGSKEWLANRKFNIGGSEMSVISGHNPYKSMRNLVELHLGIDHFYGNINTYWGTVLEDLAVDIFQDTWDCKVHELGSLPGRIESQKYSPDGLVYLDFLDQIVLLEIKNAARRIPNGKIPRAYKPQVYTGLDAIPIADIALFIDVLFRRCALEDLEFNGKYDTIIHPDKPLNDPLVLTMVCLYEKVYSSDYDHLDTGNSQLVDAGKCGMADVELLLKDASQKKLGVFTPPMGMEGSPSGRMLDAFAEFTRGNDYHPVAVMPLKLFKMEIIPVTRDDWKKVYNRKTRTWEVETKQSDTFVDFHKDAIETVVSHIRMLDRMDPESQLKKLDELYPPPYDIPKGVSDDLIGAMLKG